VRKDRGVGEMEVIPITGFSDPVSSLSHLLGALAFLCLSVVLLGHRRGHWARSACLAVFALASVLLPAISGTYHLLTPDTVGRDVMQRLDHAAIFYLIAGTFTPVHGLLFKGFWRWGMLTLIWVLAIASITIKSIFFTSIGELLGLSMYLGLGWLGLISSVLLVRRYGFRFTRFLIYGGLAYTAGAVLEFLRWPVLIEGVLGPHELFHVAVLIGLGYHWRFIYDLSGGRSSAPPPASTPPAAGAKSIAPADSVIA
jgi:channel protein (hemolysin III family)